MKNAFLFFFASFAVSFALTPLVILISHRGWGLDRPDSFRKNHDRHVPRIGGIPIMLILIAAMSATLLLRPDVAGSFIPIFIGAILIFGLGLWDDLQPLPAKAKFLGQIFVALLVFGMGLSVDKVTYPGGHFSAELGGWSLIVTVFWLIAIPNIINLIDGVDGLAGGLGLFLAATLGVVALLCEQLPAAWCSFAMGGALLGFLFFNFPPAKIFLGDGGAYLIGFFVAALSIQSSQKGSVAAVLMVTIVALGVPILDTLFAMVRRAFRGFPLFHADDEHIHHRLQNLGLSKARMLFAVYGVCVVLSLVGMSIFWSQGRTIPIAIGVVFLMALLAVRYLRYFSSWEDIRRMVQTGDAKRRSVRYALLQSQLMNLEVDRCVDADEFWQLFHETLQRVGFVDHVLYDANQLVSVEINELGLEPLTLHAPRGSLKEDDWRRLAHCFAPAYRRAMQKWSPRPVL